MKNTIGMLLCREASYHNRDTRKTLAELLAVTGDYSITSPKGFPDDSIIVRVSDLYRACYWNLSDYCVRSTMSAQQVLLVPRPA